MVPKGVLIPIGGNEDKGLEHSENYTLDFIEDSILSHVVKEAGGPDANIVIIPTASSIPKEVSDNYLKGFSQLGCSNLRVLDIRNRLQSSTKETIKILENADAVMFSGGNQSKISKFIAGTDAHELLVHRYENERFVIAGTSAGAMAMSEQMIAGGSSKESLNKGAVLMGKGLGLVKGLVIDTHFIRRGRFGRIAEAMAIHPNLLGLGLAEDTGIVIEERNRFKVIGSGMVLIFDPSNLTHNNHSILPEGTPISLGNLTVHVLANGDEFTIEDRKFTVCAIDAEYI
ncbi:MAG TPA: cyanophycinase [Balneola sp.]|jgi:cyanophycinase|nr:cyanophycinase [Bacteroidota bacterium]MAC06704.1 cyanophycinase [Balneola sp.]MAO76900.1 cyanophycinase [Balneola sp.]MBF64467.1 cyanophycinase [Balneola sp.]MBF65719.1 cyanophycinase [Balneola sp.]|tara:strand:- start:3870 stop:4727 length:858 start_codon:yes stop_codon:yes gene_type:complete